MRQQPPTRSTLALLTALVTWRESEQLALERRGQLANSPFDEPEEGESRGADQPQQLTSQVYRALAEGHRKRRNRGTADS